MKYFLGAALFLASFAAPVLSAQSTAHAAPELITPGLWEITIQMESPIAGPAMKSEVCLAGEQAKLKAPKTKAKDDCQAIDVPSALNEAAYTVDCPKSKRKSVVKFTYYGDHYDGTALTTMDAVEIRTKYTARRIGTCDTAGVQELPGAEH